MNCTEVSVLEERHQVSLGSLLESEYCLALEPDFLLELGGDLSHQSLEGELPDQQICLSQSSKEKGAQLRELGMKGYLRFSGIF